MDIEQNSNEKTSATAAEIDAVHLSIVIPCYNEFEGIEVTANSILEYMKKEFPYYTFELLLINDGSTDGTGALLDELGEVNPQITPMHFDQNLGRGAAIKAGLQKSLGRYVITLDADLSYDVEHIGLILRNFEKKPKADVVLVSPYMKGGVVKGVPASRLFISRMANWILSGFFSGKLSTVTCVVRGYRGKAIRELSFYEEGKEMHLEILRKLSICGAQIEEVPGKLIWKDKKQRVKRKTNLRIASAATKHLLYGFLIKPTRVFNYLALFLLAVGIYESFVIGATVFEKFQTLPEGFVRSLWVAVSAAFAQSPHTFLIATGSLILGLQSISFIALLQVMKLQQEETMRHLLAILQTQNKQNEHG